MAQFRLARTQCCGIIEMADISGLKDAEAVIKETARLAVDYTDGYTHNPAFLMFSGVVGTRERIYSEMFHTNRSDDYGAALAAYIKEKDLGIVSACEPAKNHSGNMIQVWLWAPKWDALKAIWETSRPATAMATPPSTVYCTQSNTIVPLPLSGSIIVTN